MQTAPKIYFMERILKKIMYSAIIFSALGLAACGGGGGGGSADGGGSGIDGRNSGTGGGSQNPDVVVPKLVSSPQTIDYYGDSTIFGWRTSASDQVATTAPEAFDAALPNSSMHTVTNRGLSGQTACELLNGINLERNWAAEMDQSSATVVILNHGINDAVSGNSVPVQQYASCLTDLARMAKERGKRVVFETPNPIAEDANLAPYVQTMRDVASAESLSLIDQHNYLNQKYAGDANVITRDGLHPRDEIYIEKGQYAASVFDDFTVEQ